LTVISATRHEEGSADSLSVGGVTKNYITIIH
jgi:hypothetical protein